MVIHMDNKYLIWFLPSTEFSFSLKAVSLLLTSLMRSKAKMMTTAGWWYWGWSELFIVSISLTPLTNTHRTDTWTNTFWHFQWYSRQDWSLLIQSYGYAEKIGNDPVSMILMTFWSLTVMLNAFHVSSSLKHCCSQFLEQQLRVLTINFEWLLQILTLVLVSHCHTSLLLHCLNGSCLLSHFLLDSCLTWYSILWLTFLDTRMKTKTIHWMLLTSTRLGHNHNHIITKPSLRIS